MHSFPEVTVKKILSSGQYGAIFLAQPSGKGKTIKCATKEKNIAIGKRYSVTGAWKTHPKFGEQFNVSSMAQVTSPENLLEAFSRSDIWPSLTRDRLKKIREYSSQVQWSETDIMGDLKHLSKALGSIASAATLQQAWGLYEEHVPVIEELLRIGYHIEKSLQVAKEIGPSGRRKIHENPFYSLLSSLVTYDDAIQLHASMKLQVDELNAIRPLYDRLLRETRERGDSGELMEVVATKIANLTGIPDEGVLECILNKSTIVDDKRYSTTKSLYRKEMEIAKKISALESKALSAASDKLSSYVVDDYLTEEQKTAVIKSQSSNLLLITGGPGTGKTTTIKEVISSLESDGYETSIVTVSGKAADRASEASGREAQTIHSFLGITPISDRSQSKYSNKAIIVDEASMVDTNLLYQLIDSIDLSCKLILVGDINQLESIEPGSILEDITEALPDNVIHLSKVQRFSEDSNINNFANSVLENKITYKKTNGLYTYSLEDESKQLEVNKKIIGSYISKHGNIDHLQVISPTWNGKNGVTNLNELIQSMIPRSDEKVLMLRNSKFYENDKVIVKREIPGSDLSTGQMMKIESIDFDSHLINLKSDTASASIKIDDVGYLRLGFCITGHSSQGSEFQNVLFSVTKRSEKFADKKMLYTIATRAKSNLIITTEHGSMEKILKNDVNKRRTFLPALMRNELQKSGVTHHITQKPYQAMSK